jgi:hypothetical protein
VPRAPLRASEILRDFRKDASTGERYSATSMRCWWRYCAAAVHNAGRSISSWQGASDQAGAFTKSASGKRLYPLRNFTAFQHYFLDIVALAALLFRSRDPNPAIIDEININFYKPIDYTSQLCII